MDILRDIQNGDYTCLVCHEEITEKSRVWSCSSCYRVYDLECVKKWSKRDEAPHWKCPHCSATQLKAPKDYRCWCGKVRNPEKNLERPHSCGQSCGIRRSCPHPCTELCHPGAHPPCMAMGPKIKCFCKKHTQQNLCRATNYDGYSCGEICSKPLPCRKHKCSQPCHKGKCGECQVAVQVRCYCGNHRQALKCSERKPDNQARKHNHRKQIGYYSCGNPCGKKLDCGNHECQATCHKEHEVSHHCESQPLKDEKCPCGKHYVQVLLGRTRESCLESIPLCGETCGKLLPCGHACPEKCHLGNCAPCELVVEKKCRCGGKTFKVKCSEDIPNCNRKCGALLTCGRHKCTRECCEFAPKQKQLKKKNMVRLEEYLNTMNTMPEAELAAHMCLETCGRMLSCGAHRCQQLCHPGQCGTCYESTDQDYECPCGKTILLAPIRCGTRIPQCTYRCTLPQPCGHQATHTCHDLESECPPCTQIVQKRCLCGKNEISISCSNRDKKITRCQYRCGKALSCGHECTEICHDGECPPCAQPCMRELLCDSHHRHRAPCHGDTGCGPCNAIMVAQCKCKNLRMEYECGEALEIFCDESCKNTEPQYHPVILDYFGNYRTWSIQIERELRAFIESDKRAHGFKPMKKNKRRLVHYLAEHYGLRGVSVDSGANRSVRVAKTPDSWLPKHTVLRSIELARVHGQSLATLSDDLTVQDEQDPGLSE